MTRAAPVVLIALGCLVANAQPPAITQNGVVNLASQIAPTLAGGPLARGALIEIRGVRLAAPQENPQVGLSHGEWRGIATVLSATPRRIEARIPEDAPLGVAKLTVSVKGQSGAVFPVEIVESNPGLFSANGLGWGPGKIYNVDTSGATSLNLPAHPAKPAQGIRFSVTGAPARSSLNVVIGGLPAVARWQRTIRPGEEDFSVILPARMPTGCYVPFYVMAAPKRASNVVTLSAEAGPGMCHKALGAVTGSGRFFLALFSRTEMKLYDPPVESIYDEAIASFARVEADLHPSPYLLLPPAGTCAAYSGNFQTATMLPDSASAALISDVGASGLDAGTALTVTRAGISRSVPGHDSDPGFFRARLGGRDVEFGPRSLGPYLDPGEYQLQVPGGRDIGAFTVTFQGPAPLLWLNRDAVNVIDRSRDLTVRWRGAAPDQTVLILASNVDRDSTATGSVICAERPARGYFTIPAELLANLPLSKSAGGIRYNRLLVGSAPTRPTSVHVSGLDSAVVTGMYSSGRFVEYR